MKSIFYYAITSLYCFAIAFSITTTPVAADSVSTPINRRTVVDRHCIVLTGIDERLPLQVGNGEFAATIDATGLQGLYGRNMAQWGWHSYPLPEGTDPAQFRYEPFDFYGRKLPYPTSAEGQEILFNWLRENPHRFNLGRLALLLDGKYLKADDLHNVRQELDLWRGLITTTYTLDGQSVRVEARSDPKLDALAVQILSPLLTTRRLSIEIAFPYGYHDVPAGVWDKPDAHISKVHGISDTRVDIERILDADHYAVAVAWQGKADWRETALHHFRISPTETNDAISIVCAFSAVTTPKSLPDWRDITQRGDNLWESFWKSGAAIDLSASKDPRWRELERRIVLSQYLTAIQSCGSLPPQESCLTNNSGWNGKFHLEMHWWHGVHFALWNRWELFNRSLTWYQKTLPVAKTLAKSQGFPGARWPKMVGPEGRESPSRIGPLLIWQQPHVMYYAELDYRLHPTRQTLERWAEIIDETAVFLAGFAQLDPADGLYHLGPPLFDMAEKTNPRKLRDPAFELSYWRFGLRIAQTWRERLGQPHNEKWNHVLANLAPLAIAEDGVYLQQDGLTDTYTKWNYEHPALVGTLGMLPGDGVDPAIMRATVKRVMATWQWDRCWGTDFFLMAMAAARCGEQELAIEALLLNSRKNRFLVNGFSEGGPYPYVPSNGGLLTAVAMMAGGWDGAPDRPAPGFPENWHVRCEGFNPMP